MFHFLRRSKQSYDAKPMLHQVPVPVVQPLRAMPTLERSSRERWHPPLCQNLEPFLLKERPPKNQPEQFFSIVMTGVEASKGSRQVLVVLLG
jgi:hypothetical protein